MSNHGLSDAAVKILAGDGSGYLTVERDVGQAQRALDYYLSDLDKRIAEAKCCGCDCHGTTVESERVTREQMASARCAWSEALQIAALRLAEAIIEADAADDGYPFDDMAGKAEVALDAYRAVRDLVPAKAEAVK